MGLLNIQEPERATTDKVKIALGIDLGTTHSLVGAYIDNQTVLFSDKEGKTLLPSVVSYAADTQKVLVGHEASLCSNAIFSVKRFIGKAFSDLNETAMSSEQFLQADEANLAVLSTPQGLKSPIQISAEILKKLVSNAKHHLDTIYPEYELEGAVITVPAYFDDGQRQATKAAAELAGIKVLRLLNEPTAAALAYGVDKQESGTYLVYDMGGGTFDVSILRLHQGVFEVLATAGDTALGGDDMDACILEHVNAQVSSDLFKIDWQTARKIKETLTTQSKVDISLAEQNNLSLTVSQFSDLIQPLIQKTLNITASCIQDAKLHTQDIQQILLVGGASRVPAIQQALTERFSLPLSQTIDPDKVVAMGAVLQAAKLMGQTDTVLLDVVPLSLGIELMGGVTEKIIARNTKLPVSITQTYTTYQDNQTGFKIKVVQGERELVKDNRALAEFELKGLPALPQGKLRIAMTFSVDVDGLLTVAAKETVTQISHQVEVKPTYGLTRIDIDSAVLNAATNAKADIIARQLAEAQREAHKIIAYAEVLLADMNNKEETDDNYLLIRKTVDELISLVRGSDIKAIVSGTKSVENLLVPISLSRLAESLHV